MAKPKNITNETVRQIRKLYSEGATQQKLSEQFKISQSTVCKIVNNYIHRTQDLNFGGQALAKISRTNYKYGY